MPREEYTAILVRDKSDRRIAKHEIVKSMEMPAADLAAMIDRRLRDLAAVYDAHRYEAFSERHDSIASIWSAYPDLDAPDDKTVILGPEYDDRLRRAVRDVLARMNLAPRGRDWGVAGSQEIERIELTAGLHRALLEAETYVGLSLTGPAKLVDRVSDLVKHEMAKSES